MDHLSFMFSLLLIVSVTTTFGSPINANSPNGEDLQTLWKRSDNNEADLHGPKDLEDQDSENSKRKVDVDAGTVIDGVDLTVGLLTNLLDVLADVKRKCAVGVDNESGLRWQQASYYYYSGTADQNLPYSVDHGYSLLYGPRKTAGPVATGVVGVIAYYIPKIHKTLAVMFSIPFDYNLYENWWNVKLYPGNTRANYYQYKDLYYYADPFRANGWHERSLGSGLRFRGSLSNSGQATLEIHVLKE